MGWEKRQREKKVKIFVGMPIHHYMEGPTDNSLTTTTEYLYRKGISFNRYSLWGNPYVDAARNKTVEAFLGDPNFKDHTHLMWIDSDMAWSPECVEKLINYDVPVASALVTAKAPPFQVTLIEFARDTKANALDTFQVPFGSYPLDKPFYLKHSCIGTAFMLIKREVLERMEPPYFTGFTNSAGVLLGTDIYFGARLNAYGYDILYDPTLRVYHVGKGFYGVEDHIAWLEQNKGKETIACPFMSSSAESVAEYKRSFSGPHPALIQSNVSAVEQQILESPLREALRLAT
jgi:hypothetical protein